MNRHVSDDATSNSKLMGGLWARCLGSGLLGKFPEVPGFLAEAAGDTCVYVRVFLRVLFSGLLKGKPKERSCLEVPVF